MSLPVFEAEPSFLIDLRRAQEALAEAEAALDPAVRYLEADLAALRVAAAVLSVRARRSVGGKPRDVWTVLAHSAPEFGEWAAFFSAVQFKCRAVRAGAVALVTQREADDLIRDAWSFHDEVERRCSEWHRRRNTLLVSP